MSISKRNRSKERTPRPSPLSLGKGRATALLAWTAVLVLHRAEVIAGPAAEAGQIIEATGVKGGLIVHVGCGDGRLTVAMRVNDSCLVHGLDADDGNIRKARDHIRSLGLYPRRPAGQSPVYRLGCRHSSSGRDTPYRRPAQKGRSGVGAALRQRKARVW